MKVKNREEAWKVVDRFFPTDYIKNEAASLNAGYPIYQSTSTKEEYRFAQIADLNTRLEANDGITTINIWIEEEKEETGMKATVRSINNEFKEYVINGVVSVQYVGRNLILTCSSNGEVWTNMFNEDVIIEIH